MNLTDDDGNTALHYASEYGNGMVVILLVKEFNADTSLKNKFGY